MLNDYPPDWYEIFALSVPAQQTESEVEFIERQLPLPRYRRLVDVGCGTGRHAHPLARRGYDVIGIDVNEEALDVARQTLRSNARFESVDMRRVASLEPEVDAFLSLWQGFGHFDDDENELVLRQVWQKLPAHGRLILDIYHRGFFEDHQGMRQTIRGTTRVTERKRLIGNRLTVTLEYDDRDGVHVFDWRVYHPEEIVKLAERVGFECLIQCSHFDEPRSPGRSEPRMQFVFQRVS
jgi:SAM-dependent methyltransferase